MKISKRVKGLYAVLAATLTVVFGAVVQEARAQSPTPFGICHCKCLIEGEMQPILSADNCQYDNPGAGCNQPLFNDIAVCRQHCQTYWGTNLAAIDNECSYSATPTTTEVPTDTPFPPTPIALHRLLLPLILKHRP